MRIYIYPPTDPLEVQFIAIRMRESDVWRNSSDDEFDNAIEAMEKLVMNRLYELYVRIYSFHAFLKLKYTKYIRSPACGGQSSKTNNNRRS